MQDKKKVLAAVSPLFLVSLMGLMSGCQSEVMGTRSYNPNVKSYAPDGSEMDTSAYTPVPQPLDDETAAVTALPADNEVDLVETQETVAPVVPETPAPVAPKATASKATASKATAKPAGNHYAPFPQNFAPPTAKKTTQAASGAKSSAAKAAPGGSYTVQAGDSFWKIAHKHGVSTNALIAANNLSKNHKLQVGQKLVIPGGKAAAAVAGTAKKTVAAANNGSAKAVAKRAGAAIPADGIHVVQSGDSLWKIANRYQVTQDAIRKENNFGANPVLQVGQKIKLPRGGAAATATGSNGAAALAGSAPAGSANDFINDLGAAATTAPVTTQTTPPAATAVPNTPAPAATANTTAPAVPAVTVPETTTVPTAETNTPDLLETVTINIEEDTPLANLAKKYNLPEETLRQYNVDIPENGIIPAGKSLLLPMQ